MLTAEQIRAARALLRWEQKRLAAQASVSLETIKRLEGLTGKVSAQTGTADAIVRALERAGVVFIPRNGGGAGVRLATFRQFVVDVLVIRNLDLTRQEKRAAVAALFSAYVAECKAMLHGDKDALVKVHSHLNKLDEVVVLEHGNAPAADKEELLPFLRGLIRKAKGSS
jgi:DNA-binding XRE family transcriptional regulator